ncbi:hypothetical protein A1O7_01566 [Cladophialophora yegresii CBS 114405]|uniref:Rrn9 domain-containing protein n=1 Tax=Cladophialophora yegresii CBS 114405 TaxID=1182544 RepID=W9WJR0_9EURO|nr:uncharacterized protein A1O7_01566 [Cladophialophora yegresii CBS 114405]EXJ65225.1 hypothetical protein A1O7_01566 [Cladophialophora yegresii CBS 114405]
MESDSTYVEEGQHVASSPSPDRILPSSPPHITQPHPQAGITSPGATSTSQRIVPSLISENPHAQGEDGKTYFRRLNRYFGPASTWLSWTKEERTTVLSLDRMRSQDLSTHLFSAFGLKRKARASAGREPKRRRKGKERASSAAPSGTGDDVDAVAGAQLQGRDSRFSLSRSWTAWPMHPDEVPREELLPRLHHDGIRCAHVDVRPSAHLEAWLIATATRLARERWSTREWEKEDESTATNIERDHGVAAAVETREDDQGDESRDSELEDANLPSRQLGDDPIFYSQPFVFEDDDDDDDAAAAAAAAAAAKDHGRSTKSKGEQSDDESTERDGSPVPLADDDKARQHFLPSARHILSSLDDLLLGLHKARYTYAAKPQGRARGKYSNSQTPEESSTRGRSSSRAASRRRDRSSSANTDVSGVSNAAALQGKRSRRVETLGLRDWSDIVGMASLTGWDPAIVEKASERCTKLFGENMLFRTFHEGRDKDGAASYFTENLADQAEDIESLVEEEEIVSDTDEDEVPVVRTSRPCITCQGSRTQCQPADERAGASRPCKACLNSDMPCSGIRVSIKARAQVCPHRSCPRHIMPFRKRYHLQRHLDSMHIGVRLARSTSRSQSRATSVPSSDINAYTGSDSDFDVFSRSGSHDAAQIVCPIGSCPRTTRPFSKGKKLYEHVRRMHPEVDVKEVKRQEARKRSARRDRRLGVRRNRTRSREKMETTHVDEEIEIEEDEGEGEDED